MERKGNGNLEGENLNGKTSDNCRSLQNTVGVEPSGEIVCGKGKGKTAKGGPPAKGKNKGGYHENQVSPKDLTLAELEFFDRFGMHRSTATLSGQYKLEIFISGRSADSPELSPEFVCHGSYTFDESSGQLAAIASRDGDVDTRRHVAVFSAIPIQPEAFPAAVFESFGDQQMPCIEVISSEIMREIQKPENEGAYFVVPSQQNGVEFPSHASVVTNLDEYKFDNTAGPRAQLAVDPAAGQFLLDNCRTTSRDSGLSSVTTLIQDVNAIIRGLGYTDTKSEFQSTNGYMKIPIPQDPTAAGKMLASWRGNLHKCRQVMMQDVLACGLTPNKGELSRCTHRVSLIYASAVPINCYVNGIGVVSKDFRDDDLRKFQSDIAQSALVVQYYGALQAAFKSAVQRRSDVKTKVFLLPLGGGAFKNKRDDIAKAMSIALEILAVENSDFVEHLDVKVLAFDREAQLKDNKLESQELTEVLGSLRKLHIDAS